MNTSRHETAKAGSERHVVETIRTVDQRARKVSFRCVCSCGEQSETFRAAGFAAGWEGRHTGADPTFQETS